MRIPLSTETDAFRVAAGLALAAVASVLVGWLFSPAYGIVLFASAAAFLVPVSLKKSRSRK